MSKTGFVLLEKHWEYNDEYYELQEEGGIPKGVYPTYADARKARRNLHVKKLMGSGRYGIRLGDYTYYGELARLTSLDEDEFEERLSEIVGESYEGFWDYRLPPLTEEQAQQVVDLCDKLELYEIVDVPIYDEAH